MKAARVIVYPGTRDEKLLDSQIGNLLSSKLGSKFEVEELIAEERLVLLPLSDIRGYDTSGMHAGIYISEAQNLDTELMKLTLQRIGEDSICMDCNLCIIYPDREHLELGDISGFKDDEWEDEEEDLEELDFDEE